MMSVNTTSGAESRTRWLRIAVFALVVRLLYWVLLTRAWKPVSDAAQYVAIARNLAHGRGFAESFPQIAVHATAFRPPLYPALLAPVMWFAGNAWCRRACSTYSSELASWCSPGSTPNRSAASAAAW